MTRRKRRVPPVAMISRGRGQSHVVGVVLMLGLTTIALGALTASVGALIEEQTSHADATSVAEDLSSALRPVETTGPRDGQVTFTEGTLSVVSRQVRVRNASQTLRTVDADALVYESGDRRVAFVGGAIVRGRGEGAWMEQSPPVTAGSDVLVVGVPRLNGSGGVGGTGGVTTTLETDVSHSRYSLGTGEYEVAIETETPGAFERYVAEHDATSTVRDVDGDGVPSVVIDYQGDRTGFVVVHDMRLEVGHG